MRQACVWSGIVFASLALRVYAAGFERQLSAPADSSLLDVHAAQPVAWLQLLNPADEPTAQRSLSPPTSTAPIKIIVPSNGRKVAGKIRIRARVSPEVLWANFYVDGSWIYTGPPYRCRWNSRVVSNGTHVVSVVAYDRSSVIIGDAAVTVEVKNRLAAPTATSTPTPVATPTNHFGTIAPHSPLPSGNQCASQIAQTNWEPRPENQDPAYSNIPASSDLMSFHSQPLFSSSAPATDFAEVDGNYSGTTDMIIRWGACKWGLDEDVMRAQAVNETHWYQSAEGDWRNNLSLCAAGAWDGWTGAGCDQSYGIYQVKVYDFNAWPMAHTSTAFNVDLHGAYQRACMNGDITYLIGSVDSATGLAYPNDNTAEMFWGCIGQWYSGGWYDPGALNYIDNVKGYLSREPWRGWPNAPTDNVGITSPASGNNLSGTVSVVSNFAGAGYIDLYIDGAYASSSSKYAWDTTSKTENGSHVLSIDAFDDSGLVIGHNFIVVNVQN